VTARPSPSTAIGSADTHSHVIDLRHPAERPQEHADLLIVGSVVLSVPTRDVDVAEQVIEAAAMPDLSSTAAQRGSWLGSVSLIASASLVLSVYIGVPLAQAVRFTLDNVLASVLVAAVGIVSVGLVIMSILFATVRPKRRTTISLSAERRRRSTDSFVAAASDALDIAGRAA